jgi:hypothetical protein
MSAPGHKPRWELFQSSDEKTHYIHDNLTKFNLAFDTDDVTDDGFRQIKQMAWAIIDALNNSDKLPTKCNPHA